MAPALAPTIMAEDPYIENLNVILVCPRCQVTPPNLIEEFSSGDMVCGDCGVVLESGIVDTRSEWRTFANDDQGSDDPSRVGDGSNPLLNGSQLSTSIAYGDSSGRGRDLQRAQNNSNHDNSNKKLMATYSQIDAHCNAINASKAAADFAKGLFKNVSDNKICKGKTPDAIIAACILIASRQMKEDRTFAELEALTKVPRKSIAAATKDIQMFSKNKSKENAKSKGNEQSTENTTSDNATGSARDGESPYQTTTAATADALVARYCSQLHLNQYIFEKVSKSLAITVTNIGLLGGRSPVSVAAACIYMASHLLGKPKNPKDIAAVTGVSIGTIRTAYKYLYNAREDLIEPDWLKGNNAKMENLPSI